MSREESFRAAMSAHGIELRRRTLLRRQASSLQGQWGQRAKFLVRALQWTDCGWRVWLLETRHKENLVRAQRQFIASRDAACAPAVAGN